MQATKIIAFAFALVSPILGNPSPAPAMDVIDTSFYQAEIAPGQVKRLNEYRTTHTLTAEQSQFIDTLVTVVKTADSSNMLELKASGEALFGASEISELLLGEIEPETVNTAITARNALKRQTVCSCTNGWGCNGGAHCPVSSECHRHKGCGALLLYVCNGVCVL
ncbi:hypothetical protein BKA64DRAFT_641892 [Cadophora sp. MPI-SDFR-AT-0126]|nr:hypothetical protein BKA64DRAFT_641892 [Leotiomycetes sp. MPI-SDFR-AT-0126]